MNKKLILRAFFLHGQRSVAEPRPTPGPFFLVDARRWPSFLYILAIMLQAEIGLLVAVLVAMNDTSEDDLDEYLNNTDGVAEEENANLLAAKTGTIPLSPTRLQFLNHLLDDVRKFV